MRIDDYATIDIWNVAVARRKLGIDPKYYTVATLPVGNKGDRAFVTDANSPTFLGIAVGGGSVISPVFFDGANWLTG